MIDFLKKYGYKFKENEKETTKETITIKDEIGVEIKQKTAKFEILSK
jgi:hypothetical protein